MSGDRTRVNNQDVTIHVVVRGKALCGFTRYMPAEWPEGHIWVAVELSELASCQRCQKLGMERKAEQGR